MTDVVEQHRRDELIGFTCRPGERGALQRVVELAHDLVVTLPTPRFVEVDEFVERADHAPSITRP